MCVCVSVCVCTCPYLVIFGGFFLLFVCLLLFFIVFNPHGKMTEENAAITKIIQPR